MSLTCIAHHEYVYINEYIIIIIIYIYFVLLLNDLKPSLSIIVSFDNRKQYNNGDIEHLKIYFFKQKRQFL